MIEIHLYGKLRALVPGSRPDEDTILHQSSVAGETFADFITRLELTPPDLGDCFVNGTLAKPTTPVQDGDRVGLFPHNMVLLCGGQHLKGHGFTQSDIDVNYY